MKVNRRQLIIGLAILFGVQLIILLLVNIFSFQSVKLRKIQAKLLTGFKKEGVISLEIKDYMDSFSIDRIENSWFVKKEGKYIPANISKVNLYLNMLDTMNKGIVVFNGSDESSDRMYGFDEKNIQTLIIKLKNKKEIVLDIGNTGSKRGTSYVRYNKEKRVREVNSSISIETGNEPISWARRNIFINITEDDVNTVEINSKMEWFKGEYKLIFIDPKSKDAQNINGKDKFRIEPLEEDWKFDDYTFQNMVKNLLDIRVSDYKVNFSVSGMESLSTIKVILKNGKSLKLDIYKATENDVAEYIIDTDFDDYLYLVHTDDIKKFIKDPKEILKKEE
ncbi:MAG TPA: DUF4340 domain-containing protein [Spirochaetota bacterium]|nr:DUF4340 domain-containing protein [Spirochaetota bacterium]HOL56261.1 DUF4340 domain-containing protein [Spirochaetota bacterium]HPP04395.1 DUF4340 domain-containing protein [Spirochaetota bacterium]